MSRGGAWASTSPSEARPRPEIPFVFNHFDVGSQSGLLYHEGNAPGRERLARQMMGYWASFARNLDPGTGGGLGPRWLPLRERLAVGHLRLERRRGRR